MPLPILLGLLILLFFVIFAWRHRALLSQLGRWFVTDKNLSWPQRTLGAICMIIIVVLAPLIIDD